MGFDALAEPTTFAAVLHALMMDVQYRRGPVLLWRHAARLERALRRALDADHHQGRTPCV